MEEFELEPGESITIEVRQHLIVLVLRLLPFIALAFLPFVIAPFVSAFLHVGAAGASYFRFFVGIYLLFLWMGLFQVVTRYFLTVWVITTHRIVDITQSGFFNRTVSSFLLARVQDVTTDVSGIFATLFGFGVLNVETAGRDEKFYMRGIRDPEGIRDLIMREVADLNPGVDTVHPSV